MTSKDQAELLKWMSADTASYDAVERDAFKAGAAALEAQAQQAEARATPREGLLGAARRVVDTFTRDEAQGYRSKDRQFAIEVLSAALRAPAEAQPEAQAQREGELRRAWLHLLWSMSLAEHMGDAADNLRAFAQMLELPTPDDYAGFGEWRVWLEAQGVAEGIHSPKARAALSHTGTGKEEESRG